MLHIKYRPSTFSEIVGHFDIVDSLKKILDKKDIPHSFLLQGDSGCGKTTIARIIANRLNGEITELNVANTTGIDYIRELDRLAKIIPLFGSNKVFILDEAQQLTKEAQNCILKLLEDAPKTSYFIFCTTDSAKLLNTLKNRCVVFSLKKLSNSDIRKLLNNTLEKEGIKKDSSIVDAIVSFADGCPRKALIGLNQVIDIDDLSIVVKLLVDEINSENEVIDLCRLITKKSSWKDIVKVYGSVNIEPENIRIAIAGYLTACLKKADNPVKFGNMLEIFLSPLSFGTQKQEILYLLYRAFMLN